MDERNTYFDEGVRRILSEPEEMLPAGLWDRIEARLDADSAGRTSGTVGQAADCEAFRGASREAVNGASREAVNEISGKASGAASLKASGTAGQAADCEASRRASREAVNGASREASSKTPAGTSGGALRAATGRKRAVLFRRSAAAVLSVAAAAALAFVLFDISIPDSAVKPGGELLAETTGTDTQTGTDTRTVTEACPTTGIAAETVAGTTAGTSTKTSAETLSITGTGIQAGTETAAETSAPARIEVIGGGNSGLLAEAYPPASGNVSDNASDSASDSTSDSASDSAAHSGNPNSDRAAADTAPAGKRTEGDAQMHEAGIASEESKNEIEPEERKDDIASEGSENNVEQTVRRDGIASGRSEDVLTVDDTDIEAVYGKEHESGKHRRTPFSLTVGANSGAGPQKNASPVMMLSRGDRTPSGTTVVENAYPESYDLPLSFGIGLRLRLTKWLSIGTGVNYTLLGKKVGGTYYEIDGSGNKVLELETSLRNRQHYIGIPLDLYFSAFRNNHWDIYGTVGGSVEKCLGNRYEGSHEGRSISVSKKVNGVQTAVKAGFGVEYSPLDFLGIYIDPSLRYYFDNGQPQSIRTAQPLSFTVEAGLRFNL